MPRQITRVERVCEHCEKVFLVEAWLARRPGEARFCSKPCWGRWRRTLLVKRFRECVGPTTDRGCILWVGWRDGRGYGYFNIAKGKRQAAHRVAWSLAHGPIPDGLCVLHRCDNPPCVNTEHLFLGTQADNVADKVAKGRNLVGERHPLAKLTETDVRTIRTRFAAGDVSKAQLARDYHVTFMTITHVVRREHWKHVT